MTEENPGKSESISEDSILSQLSYGVCIGVSLWVVSNSLWPHGLGPAKFLCPWNSPSKNTGVGHFSSVQSLSCVWLLVTPWTAARQASLSITNSRSSPKPMSIELVMPSNHLILYRPLLLLPSIIPSIRVFSNESALHIRWPKHCSFSFKSVLPINTQDRFSLGWTGWISLQSKGLSRVFSNTTVQKHQFFSA